MDKIKRWKLLSKLFLKNNTKTFIHKINGDLHFCKIIETSEDYIIVENFGPEQRAGQRDKIYWLEVNEFDEYKDRRNGNAI